MKPIKWYYNDSEPQACMGCREDMNGLWYAKIQVGKARFWISACGRCKIKAEKKGKI